MRRDDAPMPKHLISWQFGGEIKQLLWGSWWTWQVWILSFYGRWLKFMAKILKINTKKLDTEDVTTMFHDFQESICSSVTWFPPLECHDFKCVSSLRIQDIYGHSNITALTLSTQSGLITLKFPEKTVVVKWNITAYHWHLQHPQSD